MIFSLSLEILGILETFTRQLILKSSAKVAKSDKKKQPTMMPKTKGLVVLSEVALTKAEQMKLATKRSKIQFHSSYASGSGAGVRPEVPDVPKYKSESEEESWTFSQGDDDDNNDDDESDMNDDSEETESDNDRDDFVHPKLSTYEVEDKDEEEKADDDEVSDAEMTDAQENKDMKDAHVTLTAEPPVVQ
ncbi:hypothetical protein Tco_0766631 [Tanacetum coccineum]